MAPASVSGYSVGLASGSRATAEGAEERHNESDDQQGEEELRDRDPARDCEEDEKQYDKPDHANDISLRVSGALLTPKPFVAKPALRNVSAPPSGWRRRAAASSSTNARRCRACARVR